jgi:hypothetical protein
LLDERHPPDLQRVTDGPIVRALLAGQLPDGGFGVHPYSKWTGAHWRLVSLVELEVPAGEPRAVAALETVLDWLTASRYHGSRQRPDGVVLSDASMEGNALAVACRLGRAGDARARQLEESLIAWQWPDGGWNCDRGASGRRSSFHETHAPMWALFEYGRATGARDAAAAADRPASCSRAPPLPAWGTGDRSSLWTTIHYPYWHYDALQARTCSPAWARVTTGQRTRSTCSSSAGCVGGGAPEGTWQPRIVAPPWWIGGGDCPTR